MSDNILDESDDLFGHNTSYWLGLIDICLDAKDLRAIQSVIDRHEAYEVRKRINE